MTIFRLFKLWIYRTDKNFANMDQSRRAAILDLLDKEQCL
nr:MAG TPA: hypothetical protein [Caudoviricetes sp.]